MIAQNGVERIARRQIEVRQFCDEQHRLTAELVRFGADLLACSRRSGLAVASYATFIAIMAFGAGLMVGKFTL